MVIRSKKIVKIVEVEYLKPFKYFKNNLDDNKILISIIPFLRNLIEYLKDENEEDYTGLTSFLHISDKENTFKNLRRIISDNLNKEVNNFKDDENVLDIIFKEADNICENKEEKINLEEKIVLSIAIRLKVETYIIDKIEDEDFVKGITKNQTSRLMDEYKKKFKDEKKVLNVLEEVKLITPENIHINSFMYEPILDLGIEHLKELYSKVDEINKQ
jgi:hypothetical protein